MIYDPTDLFYDLALVMQPRVSPRTAIHLMSCFGSARALYEASLEELTARAELKEKVAREILSRSSFIRAEREVQFLQRNDLRALPSYDPAYPQLLKECDDYPHVLFMRGNLDLNRGRWLSVVGTRKASDYGLQMCDRLVQELAEQVPDLVLVSGLAYGIDVAIHRAALRHGIPTVAVLAHGLQKLYPAPHTQTASQMLKEGGALLTEFTSTDPTHKGNFVQRNRIVAGISEGTLVVESPRKGGSLITADMADGYHRSVMALPGRANDPNSEGTNQLIRSLRANMVSSAEQIVQTLSWESASPATNPQASAQMRAQVGYQAQGQTHALASAQLHARMDSQLPPQTPQETLLFDLPEPNELPVFTDISTDISAEQTALSKTSAEQMVLNETPATLSTPTPPTPPTATPSSGKTSTAEVKLTAYEQVLQGAKSEQSPSERVLALLSREQPQSFDQLYYLSGLNTGALSLVLIELELSGEILPLPGKYYLRC